MLTCTPEGLQVHHDHTVLNNVDCIIPRIGSSSVDMVVSLLSQLDFMGVPSLNNAAGIVHSRDKYLSLQSLCAAGLPVPRTTLTRQGELLDLAIESVGGTPVIIKLREGTQGVGVMKADSLDSARSTVQAMWSLRESVLLQEFIAESDGADIRVFVVDGKIMASMMRKSASDDFRSNLHIGGHAQRASLTPEMREIALAAAKHFNLSVAGVDLLISDRGPLITEVNPSPGLEGIENISGLDIAKSIVRAAERRALTSSTWTPSKEKE